MQENFEKRPSDFGQNAVACVPSPDPAASGSVPFAPVNAPETSSVIRIIDGRQYAVKVLPPAAARGSETAEYWARRAKLCNHHSRKPLLTEMEIAWYRSPIGSKSQPHVSEKTESRRVRSLTKKYRRYASEESSEELAEIPKVDSESFDLDHFEAACASHRECFEKWNEILAEFSRSFADCDSHPFTPDDSGCVMCGASATKYIAEDNRLVCFDCGHARPSVREHRGFWSRRKELEDPAWDYKAEGTDAIFETKEPPKISTEEFLQAFFASKTTAFDERSLVRHKALWWIFRDGWSIADAAKETGENYDSLQKRAERFLTKVKKLRESPASTARTMKLPRRFNMKAARVVIRSGVAVDVNFGTLTEREKVRISLPRFDPNLNGVFVKEVRDDDFHFWIQVHLDGKDGDFDRACLKALELTRDPRRFPKGFPFQTKTTPTTKQA